jgi:hypothetical protein
MRLPSEPERAGDTVAYAHEVVELRLLADRPGVGLRVARNTGTNQAGALVYWCRAAPSSSDGRSRRRRSRGASKPQ